MKNKTVEEIIRKYLEENKFDGLFNHDGGCACSLAELFICDFVGTKCTPGYFQPLEPGSEHDYFIGPNKHEKETIRDVAKINLKEAEKFLEEATGYKARCVYDESLGLIEASLYEVLSTDLYMVGDRVYKMEQEKYPDCGTVFRVREYKGKENE
mgnify:CR=1 FL=1